jgi:hypothetical protein
MATGAELVTATRTGMGFFSIIRLTLIIFVFGMIFINFAIIAFAQHDMPGGLKYLSYNFIKTTEKLQNESLKIIEKGTTIPEGTTKLQNIWSFSKNIWELFSTLFIIYAWLWILANILLLFPIADSSKKFTAWVIAIIIFLLLQMVITKSFAIPLAAFKDFGRALYSMFAPATQKALELTKNVTQEVNNYTNMT